MIMGMVIALLTILCACINWRIKEDHEYFQQRLAAYRECLASPRVYCQAP